MATRENTSHAEIWDDSMLVNSWNDALEEYKVRRWVSASRAGELHANAYKQYHSIKARGENVEDVLKVAEEK